MRSPVVLKLDPSRICTYFLRLCLSHAGSRCGPQRGDELDAQTQQLGKSKWGGSQRVPITFQILNDHLGGYITASPTLGLNRRDLLCFNIMLVSTLTLQLPIVAPFAAVDEACRAASNAIQSSPGWSSAGQMPSDTVSNFDKLKDCHLCRHELLEATWTQQERRAL